MQDDEPLSKLLVLEQPWFIKHAMLDLPTRVELIPKCRGKQT
jgi:hypothetical protein